MEVLRKLEAGFRVDGGCREAEREAIFEAEFSAIKIGRQVACVGELSRPGWRDAKDEAGDKSAA